LTVTSTSAAAPAVVEEGISDLILAVGYGELYENDSKV
jgi:hypothetical protein